MSAWLLILRSLRHYWRTHLGVVLGAMVSTAVLVGALAVGDSVRQTLRSAALARLGDVESAMDTGSRFFTEGMLYGTDWAYYANWAAALRLRATAANGDGSARANNVQLLGVDSLFWSVARVGSPVLRFADDEVVLNERLAAQLHVRAGDEVLLRVDKPSVLSRDAPLVPTEDASVAMRLTVAAIAKDNQLGRFSLQADQVPPYNAFLSRPYLQKKLDLTGRANLLLSNRADLATDAAIRKRWDLHDIGVQYRRLSARDEKELRTDRVFLDPPVGAAALKVSPNAVGVLTYFVNELRVGDRATPYSTVTAVGRLDGSKGLPGVAGWDPLDTLDLSDNGVAINAWLADDLKAKPGDELQMAYFVIGPNRTLIEQKSCFRVHSVVPMADLVGGRALMPNFPGVADVDNCRDWKPGIPIDLKKIRTKDEDYWKQHRGTPKAFITLAAGQKIWANRFGNLTAIRFHPGVESVGNAILQHLDPADFGLVFRPVREEALKASTQALDFGQLFLGLSFFLIAAAVLLMGLLFVFGIEQRAGQTGLLLALGFTPRRVRRLMLVEGGLLALVGGVAGAFAGTLYTRGVLAALAGVWRGAVAGTAVQYHAETATLLMGGGIGFVVALAAMWLTLRRQARRPARELLTGSGFRCSVFGVRGKTRQGSRKPRPIAPWVGLVSIAGAVAIVVAMGARRDQAAAMGFFGAGALLLIGGIALCYGLLSPSLLHPSPSQGEGGVRVGLRCNPPPAPSLEGRGVTVRGLGWRNATRRRGRSLAVVALLACAAFLVFAIGANRKDPIAEWRRTAFVERQTGHPTLHGELYGETALPVFEDLNSEAGRKAYSLDPEAMRYVTITPLRLREGDDASCLNLNRAQQPRLLGARPGLLLNRGIFTFVRTLRGLDAGKRWLLLNESLADEAVPAIGDEATVVWGLGKSVGDTLPYTDDRGRQFSVRIVALIANSILQGSLVISEEQFVRRFPSTEGYRVFLIKFPPGGFDTDRTAIRAREELSRALADVGLELTSAFKRLAEFQTVENTYLSIFQALGGLAMLLGSVGLGIVVLRNVMERRNELALLRAVGFRKRALEWLVLSEHWGLLALGLVVGTVSAVIAVLPALRSPGADVPYVSLATTLVAVAASGLLWTWLAALAALRGPLLNALRNE